VIKLVSNIETTVEV